LNRNRIDSLDPSFLQSIRTISDSANKTLFYPSAGFRLRNLFDLNYDLFLLADKHRPSERSWNEAFSYYPSRIESCISVSHARILRIGQKWIVFFFMENSLALEVIESLNIEIDCVVTVNCGCREGGNRHCENEPARLDRVFKRFPNEGGIYITDHSDTIYLRTVHWAINYLPEVNPDLFQIGDWKLNCKLIESRNEPEKLRSAFEKLFQYEGQVPFSPFYSEFLSVWEVKSLINQK